MRRRPEGCRLFVAGQHEFDGRAPERIDEIKILLAGNPENLLHALALQGGYEQFSAVHRIRPQNPGLFYQVNLS
jgi:hypothetical protein